MFEETTLALNPTEQLFSFLTRARKHFNAVERE
jgi:hypothetical protein